jgi:hypothetical protein
VNDETLEEAARVAVQNPRPHNFKPYNIELKRNLVRRAIR